MPDPIECITSPDHPALAELCDRLRELGADLDEPGAWPAEQLRLCGEYGVYRWFASSGWSGLAWSPADVTRGYLALSAACLTTTFVITQRCGACQRIEGSENEPLKQRLLPDLIAGHSFATVGISHLTTSRQHLGKPVLRAVATRGGFELDGFSPWVTGAPSAQTVVAGATLDDGRQILVALPMDLPGVTVPEPAQLVGLSASCTGPVICKQVHVERDLVLAGPVEQVMKQGVGAGTGGLQTSTLAVGLAAAAIQFLQHESDRRGELTAPLVALRAEHDELRATLLSAAADQPVCSPDVLRTRANSLALRAAQASLAAAKGTGYVRGHPAGRWCREALFFLVWSCPQPVTAANLCELAGIVD